MRPDEEDLPPEKPKRPCEVCGVPTDVHPICERWQLCRYHLAEFYEEPRFWGNDLATNLASTPGWIAEKRRERSAA